ncbi:hypothetical protein TNCV_1061861 [Trichonephila clavipes]|nr:hypothetical protein TNCV_1061861 [Trichonephila clavipes]
MTCSRRPRVTTPSKTDILLWYPSGIEGRDLHTCDIYDCSGNYSKKISATTIRQRLHLSGIYTRILRVCFPLSIYSRAARLKWCPQLVN